MTTTSLTDKQDLLIFDYSDHDVKFSPKLCNTSARTIDVTVQQIGAVCVSVVSVSPMGCLFLFLNLHQNVPDDFFKAVLWVLATISEPS